MTDLQHAVQFLQTAYMLLLALAFGEAFKQFVPDGDDPIRKDRIWALLAFLFMIFPFLHGMSRHFYTVYLSTSGGALSNYASHLMIDGLCFMLLSACFFVMSRSLGPKHWKRFYAALLTLLVVDSCWIVFSYLLGIDYIVWLELNVALAIVLILTFTVVREDEAQSPAAVAAVTSLATGAVGYWQMQTFYFP